MTDVSRTQHLVPPRAALRMDRMERAIRRHAGLVFVAFVLLGMLLGVGVLSLLLRLIERF